MVLAHNECSPFPRMGLSLAGETKWQELWILNIHGLIHLPAGLETLSPIQSTPTHTTPQAAQKARIIQLCSANRNAPEV